jgi:hypothetical protein
MTPVFLQRLHQKWFIASLFNADMVAVERDPVEDVAKVLAFARNNPQSPEARSLGYFFSAFESKPEQQSVSDRIAHDLINRSTATRLLALTFIDEAAYQIEGWAPCISSFNEGYEGAVDEILREKFEEAVAEAHPDAEQCLSVLESSIWARGASQRAEAEVAAEVVSLEQNFHARFADRKLG